MKFTSQHLLLVLCALGFGCGQGQPEAGAPTTLESGGQGSAAPASGAPAPVTTGLPGLPPEGSEPLPVVDFPMLDEVRSMDLIDMAYRFPDSLKELDGRRVSMVGFMAPFDSLDDMRRCMLVPSYVGCKFCSPPSITQVVFLTQTSGGGDGGPYPFIEEASHVSGILRLSLPGSAHEGQEQGFIYSIEDAVVTAHDGEAPERAPGHGETPHGQDDARLDPVERSQLIQDVVDLVGREPLLPIAFEVVSADALGVLVQAQLERTYPEATRGARTRALHMLGLFPEGTDWIEVLTEYELTRRVAISNNSGDRIYLLEAVSEDHPYVRLELVGAIADALTRQHHPGLRGESASEDAAPGLARSDDERRAHEALRLGFRATVIKRYGRTLGLPTPGMPPPHFFHQSRLRRLGRQSLNQALESPELGLWVAVPGEVGSFFVDYVIGDTGPLSEVQPALARPPSTTMEFFRPLWHEDEGLWRQDPVPADFADDLLGGPPVLTDVLGIGGLVPLLTKWYPIDAAKGLAGGWAGDRWALWETPEGSWSLVLEVRWQDEASALSFREAVPADSPWSLGPHEPESNRVRLTYAP